MICDDFPLFTSLKTLELIEPCLIPITTKIVPASVPVPGFDGYAVAYVPVLFAFYLGDKWYQPHVAQTSSRRGEALRRAKRMARLWRKELKEAKPLLKALARGEYILDHETNHSERAGSACHEFSKSIR